MSITDSDVTGVILAGGKSTRMGYNKALALLNGKPLIEFVLENLEEVTQSVMLSVGSDSFEYKGALVVPDLYPDLGPLGGIYSALKFSRTNLNLILSCDMPLVSASFLALLANEARQHQAAVTLPVDKDGYWQPLCAVYRKDALSALHEALLSADLSLLKVVREIDSWVLPYQESNPVFHNMSFLSINSPDTLIQAKSLMDIFQRQRS